MNNPYLNEKTRSCPTDKCKRTYEICGRCVHDHFIGNLMFGFWMKLHGFQNVTTFGSANAVNWKDHQENDPKYDVAGYVLGFRMHKAFVEGGKRLTKAKMCPELRKENDHWYMASNDTGIDYTECKPCPSSLEKEQTKEEKHEKYPDF